MPGPDGLLTAEEQQKIADWVNQKGKSHACPVCLENSWSVIPHLINGQILMPGGALVLGGQSYPFAMVACNNCFHARHFMAVPLGLGVTPTEVPNAE